jgi:uncharacterized protein (DUF169 family)
VAPDVVLVAGTPRQMMLLQEAAARAGETTAPMLGRPTCMAVPAVMNGASVVSSLGCVGNRIYTGIGDDAFYTVIDGSALERIVAQLGTIVSANATLTEYHTARRASLTTV